MREFNAWIYLESMSAKLNILLVRFVRKGRGAGAGATAAVAGGIGAVAGGAGAAAWGTGAAAGAAAGGAAAGGAGAVGAKAVDNAVGAAEGGCEVSV